jgi:hypothetical protein
VERLRTYEILLRRNNIKFEPLSKDPAGEKRPLNAEGGYDLDDEHSEAAEADGLSPSTTTKSDIVHDAKYALSKKLILVD